MVRVGKELGLTAEETVCALAGMLAECSGHNYGNTGQSDRIWHPTPDDLASRVEKDPQRIATLLAASLQWADTYVDPLDGKTKAYIGKDWASLGIYQQIPDGIYAWGWGSVEQLMNPDIACRKFVADFKLTRQEPGEPMYYRVQKVQRSQFDGVTKGPDGKVLPFAKNYGDQMDLAAALFADPEFFTKGREALFRYNDSRPEFGGPKVFDAGGTPPRAH